MVAALCSGCSAEASYRVDGTMEEVYLQSTARHLKLAHCCLLRQEAMIPDGSKLGLKWINPANIELLKRASKGPDLHSVVHLWIMPINLICTRKPTDLNEHYQSG